MASRREPNNRSYITEAQLLSYGYVKNVNKLGIVFYTDPKNINLDRYDYVEYTDQPGTWHQVPWYLIENPYNTTNSSEAGRKGSTGQQGRQVNASALEGRIALLYGQVLVGGDVFKHSVISNVYRVGYALGHGEIDSVPTIYNPNSVGSLLVINPATYEVKTGAVTQTASNIMALAYQKLLANTYIYPGLAYVAMEWTYAAANPIDPRPLFLVKGRKIYDPRLDGAMVGSGNVPVRNGTTVVWSPNDALVLADYIQDDWGGLGWGDLAIDWISVKDAADYCDVVIGNGSLTDITFTNRDTNWYDVPPTVTIAAPPGGGTQAVANVVTIPFQTGVRIIGFNISNPGAGYVSVPSVTLSGATAFVATVPTAVMGEVRHRIDIAIRRGSTHQQNIEMLRQHFRCYIVERGGKVAFYIDKPRATSYSFTKDTMRPIKGNLKGSDAIPNASFLNWTNPKKDWKTDRFPLETANVQNGIDEARPVEWTLEGITRQNEAGRQDTYLFGKARNALGSTVLLTTSDGIELEPHDRITLTDDVLLPGGSATDFEIIRLEDNSNGKFVADVDFYDPSIMTDTIGVIDVSPPDVFPDPFADLAPPSTLTVTEFLASPAPGVYVPKLRVDFTPFSGLFYGGTKITYQVTGGVETSAGIHDTGPVDVLVPEGQFQSITIKAYTVNSNTKVAGTTPRTVTTTTYNSYAPPEVESPAIVGFGSTGRAGLWFSKPKSDFAYHSTASGNWLNQTNVGNYVVANLIDFPTGMKPTTYSDAAYNTKGFDLNVAGESTIVFSTNGSFFYAMRQCSIVTDVPLPNDPILEWADSAAGPFTNINIDSKGAPEAVGTGKTRYRYFFDVSASGGHKFWRWRQGSATAVAVNVYDLTWTPWQATNSTTGPFPLTTYDQELEYRVYSYDPVTNARKLFARIPYESIPTSTKPFDIDALAQRVAPQFNVGASGSITALVTVATALDESVGIYIQAAYAFAAVGGIAAALPQITNDVAIANAANNNLALPAGPGVIRLTGGGASATITGFANGAAGAVAPVFNSTASPVTLKYLNAGSTAGNQLDIATGGDYVIPSHGLFWIVYTNGRWAVEEDTVISVAGKTGAVTLVEADVANLVTDLAAKAPLASPALTGNPTAPTPAAADNDTSIATTAFVQGEIVAKAPLASPALTGNPTAPTPAAADNDTSIATTAFVQGEIAAKAPLASPALTGNPTAPTPAAADNDTSIATTAFVQGEIAAKAPGPKYQSAGTAQTASLTVNLTAAAVAGWYRIDWSFRITTIAGTSSSLSCLLSYNNGAAKTTSGNWTGNGTFASTADISNTANNDHYNSVLVWVAAGTTISFTFTYASTPAAAMAYAYNCAATKLD